MITRPRSSKSRNSEVTTAGFFWGHIAFFAIYNFLIGYLLVHREDLGTKNLLLFVVAMALHLVINDHGLRQHHRQIYDDISRWLLAIAIICGWLIGIVTKIEQAGIAVLFAFLAGGIVLNVLKEELPPERESCFWSFAVGTLSYTILLLAT
jgi:TRAP-type C4-dicarboxylate transport system permease large subunit